MPIDYKKYPKHWKELRTQVLIRAGNRCEECGIANHTIVKHVKGVRRRLNGIEWDMIHAKKRNGYTEAQAAVSLGFTRIVLTIAHLDDDSENHDVKIDRLKALCQRCHLSRDMAKHVENRKYGIGWKKRNLRLEI